jgi:hypothetical protein
MKVSGMAYSWAVLSTHFLLLLHWIRRDDQPYSWVALEVSTS